MIKIVDSSEFDVSRKTIAATKLNDGDELCSVMITGIETDLQTDFEPDFVPLSGGYEDDDFISLDNEQLEFDFGQPQAPAASNSSELLIMQTDGGCFLKFPLADVPEKKKMAIGVRGIKLSEDDFVKNVYLLDIGDNDEIDYKGKKVELRKLKTGKRDTKGVKIRI